MSELEDAPEIEKVVSWIKGWVQETVGKYNWYTFHTILTPRVAQKVKTNDPQPTVYPDLTRDKFPLVPLLAGLNLDKLQKILRLAVTLLWRECCWPNCSPSLMLTTSSSVFQGGHGKVPWESIGADLDAWISLHRRPTGVEFADPSNLRLSAVQKWLNFFISCQTGVVPLERYIQFTKVHAGLHPIDHALSQESSRRLEATSPNKQQWVLEFDQTVMSCHTFGGMEYPNGSNEYLRFLGRKKGAALAADLVAPAPLEPTFGPANYSGLPVGRAHPMTVIDGQEKALLEKWFTALPAESGATIAELIDRVNELQSHSPASVSDQLHLLNSLF